MPNLDAVELQKLLDAAVQARSVYFNSLEEINKYLGVDVENLGFLILGVNAQKLLELLYKRKLNGTWRS